MKSKFLKTLIAVTGLGLTFGLAGCGNNTPAQNPQEQEQEQEQEGDKTVAVTSVSLSSTTLNLTVGESSTLTATILPTDATNQNVTWSSGNTAVATVDSSGKVTAVSAGQATITVKTSDGNRTASCVVTVTNNPDKVASIELNASALSLEVGKKMTLTATVLPLTALNKNVTWSSSKEDVATVENGTITGVKEGEAVITATTEDGGLTAKCSVTVMTDEDEADPYVPDATDSSILILNEETVGADVVDSKYECSVKTNYKQIYVNLPDVKVTLELAGTTLENSENSPIYVADCDSIDISAKKGTTNYIKDTRAVYTEDVAGQGKGAIYVANGDLKLKATGTLDITAGYYNGIHGKDDVEIQKLTLNINAVHHGIRGNDSITINSGNITILCGRDGLSTKNTDLSSKGNQRGNIEILDGKVTIDSWGDAVAAAHDVNIQGGTIDIKTNSKSSYNGETVDTTKTMLYLKMNESTYANGNYTYAAYINETWYKADFKKSETQTNQGGGWWAPGGGGNPGCGPGSSTSTYYIYEIEKPSSATSFRLYRFSGSNVTSFSLTGYNAVSEVKSFNESYNMVTISVSGSSISFSNWSAYDGVSSKGLKGENAVYVSNGTVTINSVDDGIHANNDAILENGLTPLGNVEISGGTVTVSTSDDGIHADSNLEISGGKIEVKTSYEGLEGNIINVSGGEAYVYATDDGMNASSGKSTPAINITGGYLDIEVSTSGDTDGIDSNGTYTQSGGVVIVKGPGRAGSTGSPAAALDTDGAITLSGGTLAVFGGMEKNPSTTNVTRSLSNSTFASGSHTISFTANETTYTTTLKSSANGCLVYSELGSASIN